METIRHHFGFKKEPFPQNIAVKDLFPLPALGPLERRVFLFRLLPEMSVRGNLRHYVMSPINVTPVSMN